jgi:hypothetical protein
MFIVCHCVFGGLVLNLVVVLSNRKQIQAQHLLHVSLHLCDTRTQYERTAATNSFTAIQLDAHSCASCHWQQPGSSFRAIAFSI